MPIEPSAALAVDPTVLLNTLWVAVAAALVLFLQAGFAYLEGGFLRAKNANTIMVKAIAGLAVAVVAYYLLGFGLMFGEGTPLFGRDGYLLLGTDNSPAAGAAYLGIFPSLAATALPLESKFLFHALLAATAAIIISGTLAERILLPAYLLCVVAVAAFVYPVAGHWVWGGGWLQERGFFDFAGSTVLHSLAGWVALIGAYLAGPRSGKYDLEGHPRAIPGHSLPMSALGALILFLGWMGLNGGSLLGVDAALGRILLNTVLAGCGAILSSLLLTRLLFRYYDLPLLLNGLLAGLVASSASCVCVAPGWALLIGAVAGALIIGMITFIELIGLDDPAGAISVHGVCGIWGTLAVALFGQRALWPALKADGLFARADETPVRESLVFLGTQALGSIAVFLFAAMCGLIIFTALRSFVGLRPSKEKEFDGLDLHEHGLSAYPDPDFPQPLDEDEA